jgi:hypothetical protein
MHEGSCTTDACSLCLQAVDRPAMLSFLRRMCVPAQLGGGFTLCQGECMLPVAM